MKKKKKQLKKKKKMIATILEPRNQVTDWRSRKLDLYSCQGFSFSPAWKAKAPTPCISSLAAVARPSLLPDSSRFMLPPPSLQPCYRE